MSGPYPRLTNGHGTDQGIWEVREEGGNPPPVTIVGTWAVLDDGRKYRYARSSGAAIVAGKMLQSETVHADMDDLTISAAVPVGGKTILVTAAGSKTYAENELSGGYILSNSGTTGQGIAFRIKSNILTGATAEFAVQLFDGLPVILDSGAKCTVMKNPWMDVVINTAGTAQYAVGASNIGVDSGAGTSQYFWCQVSGLAAIFDGDTTTIGEALEGDDATAGATEVGDGTQQNYGTQLFTGVDGDWSPVALTIAS